MVDFNNTAAGAGNDAHAPKLQAGQVAMSMDQLQDALANSPNLIEKNGIQFSDGSRVVSIPAGFSYGVAAAVADAIAQMIAEKELSGND